MSTVPAAPPPGSVGITSGEALGAGHLPAVAALLSACLAQEVDAAAAARRSEAEAQKKALENRPGWRACLLQIGLNSGQVYSEELRLMALIQLKNGLEPLFRAGRLRRTGAAGAAGAAPNRDEPEKQLIKAQLLRFHTEGGAAACSERVAGLVSDCIAICAKADWPADWSGSPAAASAPGQPSQGQDGLFQGLLSTINPSSASPLSVLRALYTLHQVLKSLQGGRLLLSVDKFQKASKTILTCVRTRWAETQTGLHGTLVQLLGAPNPSAALTPELLQHLVIQSRLALLYLKCLKRLVPYGVENVAASPDAQALFPALLEHMQALVNLLPRLVPEPASPDAPPSKLDAFVQPLTKAHVLMLQVCNDTLERHPAGFHVFFAPFTQFAVQMLTHNATLVRSRPLDLDGDGAAAVAAVSPASASSASPNSAGGNGSGSGVDPFACFPGSTVLERFSIECMHYLERVLRKYLHATSSPFDLLLQGKGFGGLVAGAAEPGTLLAGARAGANAGGGADAMSSAQQTLMSLFTPQYTADLFGLLVAHYLVLRREDMEAWNDNAEDFYLEERSGMPGGGDDDDGGEAFGFGGGAVAGASASSHAHEFKLRTVAEGLLRRMIDHMTDTTAPALLQLLMSVLQLCPPGSVSPLPPTAESQQVLSSLGPAVGAQTNLLLLKESLYTAMGFGFLHLPSLMQVARGVDFGSFWTQVLSRELAQPSEKQRLVRRRVVWLLGEWVESVPDELRPTLGAACIQLLREDDLLLRLAAIDALDRLLDNVPYNFNHGESAVGGGGGASGESEEDALDLTASPGSLHHSAGHESLLSTVCASLPAILELLFFMLSNQLEDLHAKQHGLHVLKRLLSALGARVLQTQAIPVLLKGLPALWAQCGGGGGGGQPSSPSSGTNLSLLRSAILDVVTGLVRALGPRSAAIHAALVLPLIQQVMSASSSSAGAASVGFALDLWLESLKCAVVYTAELGSLFPSLVSYVRANTAHLRSVLSICESYVHLGKAHFMAQHAGEFAALFAELLTKSQESPASRLAVDERGKVVGLQPGSGSLSNAMDGEGDAVTDQAAEGLMAVLESVAQIYPEQTPALFARCFRFVLRGMLDEARHYELEGRDQEQIAFSRQTHVPSDQVLASYIVVLGRLFFQNTAGTLALLQALSGSDPVNQLPVPPATFLSCVLDSCARKLDCIANVYKKKVVVLGLVALVPSAEPAVLHKFSHIMKCVRRVERELAQPGAQLERPDWSAALRTPAEDRMESHRTQLMLMDDPSNNVSVRQRFLEHMAQLQGRVGPQTMQQLLATCDPLVWQAIESGQVR